MPRPSTPLHFDNVKKTPSKKRICLTHHPPDHRPPSPPHPHLRRSHHRLQHPPLPQPFSRRRSRPAKEGNLCLYLRLDLLLAIRRRRRRQARVQRLQGRQGSRQQRLPARGEQLRGHRFLCQRSLPGVPDLELLRGVHWGQPGRG